MRAPRAPPPVMLAAPHTRPAVEGPHAAHQLQHVCHTRGVAAAGARQQLLQRIRCPPLRSGAAAQRAARNNWPRHVCAPRSGCPSGSRTWREATLVSATSLRVAAWARNFKLPMSGRSICRNLVPSKRRHCSSKPPPACAQHDCTLHAAGCCHAAHDTLRMQAWPTSNGACAPCGCFLAPGGGRRVHTRRRGRACAPREGPCACMRASKVVADACMHPGCCAMQPCIPSGNPPGFHAHGGAGFPCVPPQPCTHHSPAWPQAPSPRWAWAPG